MKARASVVIAVESDDDMKLTIKLIQIVVGPPNWDDFVFEWFRETGHTEEDARANCIDSIAFYLRCRSQFREQILNALDPESAREVRQRLR